MARGSPQGACAQSLGRPLQAAAIRAYGAALRLRVYPALGAERLSDVSRIDLKVFTNNLKADGLKPSTIVVTLLPLRAI
jgi:hypothetical protein